MNDRKVAAALSREGKLASQAIAEAMHRTALERGMAAHEVFDMACRAAWTDGLDVGLQIALTDVSTARAFQRWYREHVLEDVAASIADTEETAGRIMAAVEL